jgi:hypothetical protein
MTISNTTVQAIYNGNGSTKAFAVPGSTNSFSDNSEIVVEEVDSNGVHTSKTMNVHYTVSGGNPGSTVNMVIAPASGVELLIYRDSAQTQSTDFIGTGAFDSEANEDALDKLTRHVQEVKYDLRRAIKFDRTDTDALDTVCEAPVEGSIVIFGATGLENGPSIDDVENVTLAAAIASATSSQTAASASATSASASATASATSAAAAVTSASGASTSATAAATSATAAATSATAAATSATAAATSATSAATNLATLFGRWMPVFHGKGTITAASTAAKYMLGTGDVAAIKEGVAAAYAPSIRKLVSSDYPAIGSLNAKFRYRFIIHTNDVAPGVSFDININDVSRPGTSGGAGLLFFDPSSVGGTIGVVTTITTPAADLQSEFVSSVFSISGTHYYCFIAEASGTLAASSHVSFQAVLEYHYE